VADRVLRANYIQQLAQKAHMGRTGEETLNRQLATTRRRRSRPAAEPLVSGTEAVPPVGMRPAITVRAPREEYCLAMLYQRPDVAALASSLTEDLFSLSENRELLRRWRSGEAVAEDEAGLWEQHLRIFATKLPEFETIVSQQAFLDCMARLEQARMKEVKEASALALAEGEAGVRPGQVASIARARWEAGQTEENLADDPESVAAS